MASAIGSGIATGSQIANTAGRNVSESTSGKDDPTLGYDAFLKLLVAQMQNQDPLQPMNSSDYVAQLATFSQVEKSISMNERLGDLLSAVRLQQAQAVVGMSVASPDGQFSGVVTSARIVGNDVIALLEDGRTLKIDADIQLSRPR